MEEISKRFTPFGSTVRRGFLLAVVCISILGLASCGKTQLEADIVVIGAGSAGLSAGIQAAQEGADVIVFEKMPMTGGTSQFAEGVFGMNSSVQKARGISFDENELFRNAMEFTHWKSNARLVRTFMNKSGETIDWLLEQGLHISEVKAVVPGEPATWHVFEGRGAALTAKLTENLKGMDNVRLFISTPVTKLLMSKDGKVKGVEAENEDGETIRVNAKAVIIATGGFANNVEMMKEYTGFGEELNPVGNAHKTGDGINMALSAGSGLEGISTVQLFGPLAKGMGFTSPTGLMSRQPTSIWVASDGRRFCDEGIAWNFSYSGNAQSTVQDQVLYSIFDEKAMRYMIEEGVVMGAGDFVLTGTPLVPLPADMEKAREAGILFEADSIGELAEKTGLDKTALEETLKEYNGFCEKGRDDLFAKNENYLWPINSGKYYAVLCENNFIGTIGGIRIDEKMQVLNNDYKSIPGLYAGGSCAGGMYGDTYNLITAGGTFGFAVNSGRIAAESAASYLSGE